jgi:serine/threonine protein kinase/tetratricopeptide (TPR) repeat protein
MPADPEFDREQMLDQAIADWLDTAQAGATPQSGQWLRAHPELADELADFLKSQERFERLLAPLRPPRRRDAPPPADGGKVVGDYELEAEIGRGGMGVVYRARQRSLNRPVAVKILRAAEWSAPEERRRFRWEAEAVARLDHPHIVPIFEVSDYLAADGTTVPFFSMKLIEGKNLADERERLVGQWLEIARLLAETARAMDHAHRRGIIHRDLKPANILLAPLESIPGNGDASAPAPFITDFGLAKHISSATLTGTPATKTGAALGTPSYMAPEQILNTGAVTTAADVYSLGAILYELLTGRPPFRAESPPETLRQALDETPLAPRTLRPDLPRDLEIICQKCLEKDPARRYDLAAALADDLDRFRRGQPIQARAVGSLERFARWCRRRPAVAGLAATLVVVTLTALPLITWNWRRAVHSDKLARKRLEETELQRQAENESFLLAYRAVSELATQVADERLRNVPGAQPVRKEMLEAALKYYQEFVARRGDDPKLRHELADAYFRCGAINAAVGKKKDAAANYEHSLSLWRELLQADPDNTAVQLGLGRTLSNLGTLYLALSRAADSERALREAVGVFDRLARQNPANAEFIGGKASALINLGLALREHADVPGTLDAFRQCETTLAAFPGPKLRDQDRMTRAKGLHNIGQIEEGQGRHNDALRSYEKALDVYDALRREAPQDAERRASLALCYRSISVARMALGDADEALKAGAKAQGLLEELVRQNPAVTNYQWSLSVVYDDLGIARKKLNQPDEAMSAYRKAEAILRKLLAADADSRGNRQSLAMVCRNIGNLHRLAGRLDDARKSYEESKNLLEQLVAGDPNTPGIRRELLHSLGVYGDIKLKLRQPEEAVQAFEQAVTHARWLRQRLPQDLSATEELSMALGNLAIGRRAAGRADLAVSATEERLALWPENPEEICDAARDLAKSAAALRMDRPTAADQAAHLAVEALRRAVGAGLGDVNQLKTDPALAPLRDRPDFKALFAGPAAAPPKSK